MSVVVSKSEWSTIRKSVAKAVRSGMSALDISLALEPKSERKVIFCGVFISALIVTYRYCKHNKTDFVEMKKIKSSLSKSEYARYNDLVRFGFARRPSSKNGEYIFDLPAVERFFSGTTSVSAWFLRDARSDSFRLSKTQIFIGSVPSVEKVVEEYGEKFTEYVS
jgi:hypothetical protein